MSEARGSVQVSVLKHMEMVVDFTGLHTNSCRHTQTAQSCELVHLPCIRVLTRTLATPHTIDSEACISVPKARALILNDTHVCGDSGIHSQQ